MKNNKLVLAAVVAVVCVVGFMLIVKPSGPKKVAAKAAPAKVSADKKAAAKPVAAPAKKVFAKGMGGLTVKCADSRQAATAVRMRVFKAVDAKSSVFVVAGSANRMVEIAPGSYDAVLETMPQKIYKGLNVSEGRETIEAIAATGSLEIKAVTPQKKPATYPVRVLYPRTTIAVGVTSANRPLELVEGIYDVEIGVAPAMIETGIKVESGKPTVRDLGVVTGTLVAKAVDTNNKEMRYSVTVKKADGAGVVASAISNRPVELRPGVYQIDLGSRPAQTKKDIKVNAGEEIVVDFVPVPAAPAPVATAVPAKPAAVSPAAPMKPAPVRK